VNKNVLAARLERLREYIHNLETVQQFECKRFIEDPFIHAYSTLFNPICIYPLFALTPSIEKSIPSSIELDQEV